MVRESESEQTIIRCVDWFAEQSLCRQTVSPNDARLNMRKEKGRRGKGDTEKREKKESKQIGKHNSLCVYVSEHL